MPTDCSADRFEFAPAARRAVVAGFDGGRITSDAGGLPELVGTDAGLVVPAADGEALAGAIGRLLDDQELRRRAVEGGRRTVERYSAAGMASGVRQVYDSISANR